VDPDTLARALREAHGCPPGCEACRRQSDEPEPGGLARFLPLVTGEVGLRFGRAHAKFGLPIPAELFTADPLEQWLIREALMERYAEQARREQEAAEEREAQRPPVTPEQERQARDQIAAFKAERDG
jgi:hypothetical protein